MIPCGPLQSPAVYNGPLCSLQGPIWSPLFTYGPLGPHEPFPSPYSPQLSTKVPNGSLRSTNKMLPFHNQRSCSLFSSIPSDVQRSDGDVAAASAGTDRRLDRRGRGSGRKSRFGFGLEVRDSTPKHDRGRRCRRSCLRYPAEVS